MSKLRQYQADAKIADLRTACRLVNAAHDYLESKVVAQAARISALEKALEPFAREAGTWADSVPDGHRSLCTEPGSKQAHPGSETTFTVGDLRTARALLDPRNGE